MLLRHCILWQRGWTEGTACRGAGTVLMPHRLLS